MGDAILIDLQDLLGVRTPWPPVGPRVSDSFLASFLENEVYRALLATEWPEELIRREHRPDFKTAVVMDFTLCNKAGEVIAAIEVQGQRLFGTAFADAQTRRILNLSTDVEYVFVTDSRQYQLFRRDGETSLSSNPPRPIDIDMHTRD